MVGERKDRSVNISVYWKVIFPVLTLVLLLFLLFVVFAIPDWALTDKCNANPAPRLTHAVRSGAA